MVYPDGVTKDKPNFNEAQRMAVVAFAAITWWNVIELNIQVFVTFKRHRGLYFWSLLITSYGCVLHALGFLLKFLVLTEHFFVAVTILTVGWYCMVTGQAIVLYSRLHLVVREQKVLRGILAMIIVNAFCFHIPTTVLTYASNSNANNVKKYIRPFNAVESLQMTAFCIQEFIISGVYVYSTIKLLRPSYHGRTRKVMMMLIWINLIIIAMDIGLLSMEYSKNYDIEATSKPMFYSVKLKLEFAVLNQLMTLANSSVNNAQNMHIQDHKAQSPVAEDQEKPDSYWARYVSYPRDPDKPSQHRRSTKSRRSRSGSTATENTRSRATMGSHDRIGWIPALDRNCIVKTTHIENVSGPLNEFTNPAACFRPGKANHPFPPHDGLGGIPDSAPASPTLTGTTLDYPSHSHHRRPSPPHLDLEGPPVMSNRVFLSSRPSVTDWANGPESECSPNADEMAISPYDTKLALSKSPGSVKAGRGRAEKNLGIDFVTSALHD